jgi:purine nucleosidase
MSLRVLLDTDPGIDDALAILLAVASPELDLRAVTVTGGNCPLAAGVANARAVLALAKQPHIPVCPGVALPLLRPAFTAAETHGASGLGYAILPASDAPDDREHGVDCIIREILSAPGQLSLVPVAPLTNIALAVRKEPTIVDAVKEVIIMGGAVRVDGNTTSLAEFNFFVDPHAAHIVLTSGMPITLVPWDITRDVMLHQHHIDRLLAIDSPLTQFIADATRFYLDFHYASFGIAGCSINDPVALALTLWPELARTESVRVDIEYTSELTIGKTVLSYVGDTDHPPRDTDMTGYAATEWPATWRSMQRPKHNVRLVTHFDSEAFIERFVQRMEALARTIPA